MATKSKKPASPDQPSADAAPEAPSPKRPEQNDPLVESYGDLVFDLCQSVLWSSVNAQIAFRGIVRRLRAEHSANSYVRYERAWVLRIACAELLKMAEKYGRRLSPSEQIMLDAALEPELRLRQFDSYFHRLPSEEQIILLLRDKYGFPYSEIAAALGYPEGSLKVRRQQALRNLDDWLWNQT